MSLKSWFVEKLNPAQSTIADSEMSRTTSNTLPYSTKQAYKSVEVVSRCVNLLVDHSAQVDFNIDDAYTFSAVAKSSGGIRKEKLKEILNVRPNPYMDISTFRRLLMMDFFMEGWAFIHWDGYSMFHIPAQGMEVFADKKAYVNKFVYDGKITYSPDEIIFIKDNAYEAGGAGQLLGQSRIMSCLGSITERNDLLKFKQNFFKNGALFSLVIETDAVLSKKIRRRFEEEITTEYNPTTGKRKVLILDAGMKGKSLTPTSTKDLEVSVDVAEREKRVTVALGVPPILLDSGNNANIRPNIDLFYYMTILPTMKKFKAAFEMFFAYEVILSTDGVAALMPDKLKEATAVVSKLNNGVIDGHEARRELRYDPKADPALDKIRIPQNVAGSATGVSGEEGGAPATSKD